MPTCATASVRSRPAYYHDFEHCWFTRGGPPTPPPIEACIAEVLLEVEGAEDFIRCVRDAQLEFVACIEVAACSDLTASDICAEEAGLSQCPPIPYVVEAVIAERCYGIPFPEESFVCDGDVEIPIWWVCDGYVHCVDGSDEHPDCPPPPHSFMCSDGTYIDENWVCDGIQDCPDGSDEASC